MALAGYPVGLTIAPIMPVGDWRRGYAELFATVAEAVNGVAHLDLTVELITHRFHARLERGAAGLVSQDHARPQ